MNYHLPDGCVVVAASNPASERGVRFSMPRLLRNRFGFAARQGGGFFAGNTEIEAQLLEGTIGQAATIELVGFLRLFRQLPSIPEILLNPDTAPVPDEPSSLIAIATALGRVLHPMNKALSSVVRIQKTRTTRLLDHPFFGTLLFRLGAPAGRSIATIATDGAS